MCVGVYVRRVYAGGANFTRTMNADAEIGYSLIAEIGQFGASGVKTSWEYTPIGRTIRSIQVVYGAGP